MLTKKTIAFENAKFFDEKVNTLTFIPKSYSNFWYKLTNFIMVAMFSEVFGGNVGDRLKDFGVTTAF